jgi:hypothetical protein
MLTAATLGLAGYGLYAIGAALADLIFFSRLELWANLGVAVLGMTLLFAAVLVRARVPGGLLFALGGLLGLQAVNLHNSMHLHGSIQIVEESARAVFGALLMLLGWWGGKREPPDPDLGESSGGLGEG